MPQFRTFTLLALSLVLAGSAFAAPFIATDPETVDFGDVYIGDSPSVDVTVTNTGDANLTIDQISTDNNVFIAPRMNQWVVLAPEESHVFAVQFAPQEPQAYNGNFIIHSDASNGDGDGNFMVPLSGTGLFSAPVIAVVTDPDPMDFELFTGGTDEGLITVSNDGVHALDWTTEIELFENGRDVAGRELNQVDGAAGPKRDEAGEVLDEYEIPYPSTTGLAWDPDDELIWGYANDHPGNGQGAIFAFDPAQGEVVAEYGGIESHHQTLTYWEGLLYLQGNNRAGQTIFVYDLEGRQVRQINTPFQLSFRYSTISELDDQALFFIRGTQTPNGRQGEGYDAVYVYTWPDFNEVAHIQDGAETGDMSTCGVLWVPKDKDGQLWVDGSDRLYELNVDDDWNCELVQEFRVAPTVERAGMTHDKHDIWRAVRQWQNNRALQDHTMLQRIDDGVAEAYWIGLAPEEGEVIAGESQDLILTLNAFGLAEDIYEANIHFLSNDPANPDLVVPVSLAVTGAADINATWSEDYGYPDVLDWNHAYAELFTGGPYDLIVEVTNEGSELLEVSDVSCGNGFFTANPNQFNLAVDESRDVTLTFNADINAPDDYSEDMVFTTNDPDEEEYLIHLHANASLPPIGSVLPDRIDDELSTGEKADHSLTVTNDGDAPLRFTAEIVLPENGRDIGERELRRVDGATGPKRDVPGEVRDEYEIPYTSITGLAWDPDNELIWGYANNYPRDQGAIFAFDPAQGEVVAEYRAESKHSCLTYWEGLLYLQGNTRANTTIFVYDLEGNQVQRINTPFSLQFRHSTIGAIDDQAYFFIRGMEGRHGQSEGYDAVYVYTWPDFDAVAHIPDAAETGDRSTCGVLWVPKDETGQLWVDGMDRLYELKVEDDWSCQLVQQFAVERTPWERAGMTHDKFDIWRAVRQWQNGRELDDHTMLQRIDDGVSEPYWISIAPEEGEVDAGNQMDVVVTLDAEGLEGGDYEATIVFTTNDPANRTINIAVLLTVNSASDIEVTWSDDYGLDPLDWNSPALYADQIFCNSQYTANVKVENSGVEDLDVTDFACDLPEFTANPAEFSLQPGESQVVTLTFEAADADDYNGAFTVANNSVVVPEYLFNVHALALNPPLISVEPDEVNDSLFTGGISEHQLTVTNVGEAILRWNAEAEIAENGRDAAGRQLRRVDGAVGPKRDDAGEVLDEYEVPYPSTTGLAWDPDNELIWGYCNDPQGTIYAFDPAQGEIVADYGGIEAKHQTLTYWEGLLYLEGNNRADRTLFVYDLEGNLVERINTPFQTYFRQSTIGAIDDQAYFFIRGTQSPRHGWSEGYDAVYVYTWPDFDAVAHIQDGAATGDMSTCGILWFPKDKDGQLWVDGRDRLYELYVDEDWNCELVQDFAVEATPEERAGITHGKYDIWRAVRQWQYSRALSDHTMLQRIDDGVSEMYWIGIAPEEGELGAGESQEVILTLNAFGLAEDIYEANIHFLSNDPTNPDLAVPVSLAVTGAADINATWDEDYGYPDVLDWNLVYSDLFSGGPYDIIVEVANEGSEALEVNDVSCNNGFFTANPTQFNLAADESRDITLTFNADIGAPGDYTEDMIFSTNDPDEEEYLIHMHANASLPPIGSVLPDRIDDELSTGEKADHSLTVTNDGEAPLRFTIDVELPNGLRDAVGRELRRVDGAAGPKRDVPGEVLDEYEIPYPSTTGLAWDPDDELIWGYANDHPGNGQGAIFAFDPAQGEVVAEYGGIESHHQTLTYWEGQLYLQGNNRAGNTIFVYDLEGNRVNQIYTPFQLSFRYSTISAIDDQAYFFIRGTQTPRGRVGEGSDAVYVYTWPDFQAVAHIQDAAETGDYSTCGVLWVPKDEAGQLWVDGMDQLYELKVEDDWSCRLVQGFEVDPTVERAGMTHDKFDIWRAERRWEWGGPQDNHTMLQRIDDGVSEMYWMGITPKEGVVDGGNEMEVVVTLDAEGLEGGDYEATIIFSTNDPANRIINIAVFMTVDAASDIEVTWPDEYGEPTLDWNSPALYSDQVFHSGPYPADVRVENTGVELLEINDFACDLPEFTANPTEFNLQPGESRMVTLTFEAAAAGDYNGTFIVENNSVAAPEYHFSVHALAQNPPLISVEPDEINDSLLVGQTSQHQLTVTNVGDADLIWNLEVETIQIPGPGGRDVGGGRELRRVDGAAGPKRDDPGEVLDEYEIPYTSITGLAWDPDNELIWGYANNYPGRDQGAIFAFDPAQGEVVAEYGVESKHSCLTYWEGLLYLQGNTRAGNTIMVYDLEGNQVQRINTPFNLVFRNSTIGAIDDQAYFFIRGIQSNRHGWSEGYDAVYVYTWPDFQEVAHIQDGAETGDMSTCGVLWVPKDEDGQLWVDGMDQLYELYVDEDWNCQLVQQFAVEPTPYERGGFTHDKRDIWRAVRQWQNGRELDDHTMLQRIDDGVQEQYWLMIDPTDGFVGHGAHQDLTLTFNAAQLWGGDHIADLHFFSNDPTHGAEEPDATVRVTLSVTAVPDITAEAPLDKEEPIEVNFNDYYSELFNYGSYTVPVTIINDGTEDLNIDRIESNEIGNPHFTCDPAADIVIAGMSEREVTFSFASAVAGEFYRAMIIYSDDPDESEYVIDVDAVATEAPEMVVDPNEINDALYTGGISQHQLTVTNAGGSVLRWTAETEIIENERDAAGRELRRVDGAAGPKRDEAGEVLDEYEIPYPSTVGLAWDPDDELIWGYVNDPRGQAVIFAFDPGQGAVVEEYGGIVDHRCCLSYWEGLLYINGSSWDRQTIYVYDLEGNQVDRINTPFSLWPRHFTISEWDDQAYFFIRGTQGRHGWGEGYDAVYVYTWPDFDAVAHIQDANETGDMSTCEIMWVPKDADGQLWVDGTEQLYELYVDEDWNCQLVQEFAVERTPERAGLTHDKRDIWRAVRQWENNRQLDDHTMLQRIDDGVSEMYWLSITPEEGSLGAGRSQEVLLTLNAFKLAEAVYEANIHFLSNDPANPEIVVPVSLDVTGAADINATWDEGLGYPDVLDWNLGYSELFSGGPYSLTVEVANEGTAALEVSDAYCNNDFFTANPTQFDLAVDESRDVTLTFNADIGAPGNYTEDMVFVTDDPDEQEYILPMHANASLPPIGSVSPEQIDEELYTGEKADHPLTVTNDGAALLRFTAEIVLPENGRDAAGRELRRVDGAAGPKRDEAGEVLDEYEIPYPSLTGLAWDPDNELIWGYANNHPQRDQAAIFAFDPAQGEVVAEYGGIETKNQTLTYWEGLLYLEGNNRAGQTIFVYDLEGNLVERINTPFNVYFRQCTISAIDDQAYFFIRGTQGRHGWSEGYDAVYVYTWPDFQAVAHIQDAAETNDMSTSGILWIPKDEDGQLWVDGMDQLYELYVDDDWNCQLVQQFAVERPPEERLALTHDRHDIWRAVRQWSGGRALQDHTTLQRIDDGVSEAYWIKIAPEEGEVSGGGNQMDVMVTLDAEGLVGGDYEATVVFSTNDPSNRTINIAVFLTVDAASDIEVTWPDEYGELALDWNSRALYYNQVFSGGPYTTDVEVKNSGVAVLDVTDFACDLPEFTANPTEFSLEPGESRTVTLTFEAAAAGDYNGTFIVENNSVAAPEYPFSVHANALNPPLITVEPDEINDALLTGETSQHELTVTNVGTAELIWNLEVEMIQIPGPGGRDVGGGRELRRVDGAAGPKRDDPGEVLDEYEVPYPSTTGLTWDPDDELIWGYCNAREGTIYAFDPAQGEVVAEYGGIEAHHQTLTYWEGQLYLQGNNRAGQTIFVYDLEGNQVNQIRTPFNLYYRHSTIGAIDDQAYFFIRGSQNLNGRWGEGTDAVYVYTWPDFEAVAHIQDAAETGDQSTCGVLWVPKDTDGQLWVDGTDRLYELYVDDDWNCQLVQQFAVDATVERAGMTHDKRDIWRAVRQWQGNRQLDDHTMLQRIDDGVQEQYWLMIDPTDGKLRSGRYQTLTLTFNATSLWGGDHIADLHFFSNDPTHPDPEPDVTVRATLSVTAVPDITADAPLDDEEPIVVNFNDYFDELYNFGTYQIPVTIINDGTEDLNIDRIESDEAGDPRFTCDPAANIVIAGMSETLVNFIFHSDDAGEFHQAMTIFNDDPTESEYVIDVDAVATEAPEMVVDPEGGTREDPGINYDLFEGDVQETSFNIANGAERGAATLTYTIKPEILSEPGDRDAGGRELRRVDGAVGPKRDDPGEVLDEYEIPYPSLTGLAWDPDNEVIWGYGNNHPGRDQGGFFAFDPAQGEIVADYGGIESKCRSLTYWEGLLYLQGNTRANRTLFVYDLEGNRVDQINTPFNLDFRSCTIGAIDDQAYFFLRGTQARRWVDPWDAVNVYTWPDFDAVARIEDAAETGDMSTCGILWVPVDEEGQLWVDGMDHLYELFVDDDWNCQLVQDFAVEPTPYELAGMTHDKYDIWRAVRNWRNGRPIEGDQTMLQRIDDGVQEMYWLMITPTEGAIPPGGDDDIIVTINTTGLIGGLYEAVLHIWNNDPRQAAGGILWPAQVTESSSYDYYVAIDVTGMPHVEVTPGGPEDVKDPIGEFDKPPVDFGIAYFGWDPDDNIILYPDTAWVEIENVGTDDLEIDDIYSDDEDHFYANVDDLPLILSVGEVDTFPLFYTPDFVENNESIVHFVTNDNHWPDPDGYPVRVMGTGMGAPVIFVDPDVFDDLELGPGESHDEEISVTNEGESMLDFALEIQTDFEGRDQAGRELRRVDGAAGPKRDDPGEVLDEYEIPYPSTTGLAWDPDNKLIWGYCNVTTQDRNHGIIFAFDPDQGEVVAEYGGIEPHHQTLTYWEGLLYVQGNNRAPNTIFVYDLEGNRVNQINTPFNIYFRHCTIGAIDDQAYFFIRGTQGRRGWGEGYDAVYVYTWPDFGAVAHIQDAAETNDMSTCGVLWIPKDADGQLWVDGMDQLYELYVDEDWNCQLVQQFAVDRPPDERGGITHDRFDIWRAVRNWQGGREMDDHTMLQRIDDGVSESYWILVDPMEGSLEPGADMILILTLNATGMLAGEYYAEIHFFSNDPVCRPDDVVPDVTVPVTLTVTESPMVGTEPIFQPFANAIDRIPFADTYLNEEDRVTVTLINTGNAPLEVTELEGGDEFWFDVDVGMTIAGFEEADVDIVFSPDAIGQRNGVVGLYTNGQNVEDGHVWVDVTGLGQIPPEIVTDPGDGGWIRAQNRLDAEPWTREFTIGNAAGNGRRALTWEISIEEVELGGRDAAGRELRRVDGAAGPKRDDPGEVLDEYEIPYPSTSGLAWDPDNKLIWGYANDHPGRGQGTIYAFDPEQGEVVQEYGGIESHHQTLTYWEGLLYVEGNNRADRTLFVYDLEGNRVDQINTPFQTYFRQSTIGEWNDQAYFFIRGTQSDRHGWSEGYDAVYVYTWPDFDAVAHIRDAAETGDMSTCGVLWVPKDGDGQLWVDGMDRLYELKVDDDWDCELVQEFDVDPTPYERGGFTHDKFDIWRAVRNWRWGGQIDDHTMLQRIDDGVAEQYWMIVEPDNGTTPAGESSVVNLNYSVANLLPDTTYLVDMLIESNDPATPIVTIHLSLTTGVPPLRHFTGFTETNLTHTVHVTEATFLNQPIPTGWEIGAFTPGGVLAGGAVWNAAVDDWMFTTYGDDPNTGGVEGFADGEVFTFMMWDEDADAEFSANITFVNGDQRWVSDGESWVSLNGTRVREQVIDLANGWNLISLNIRPGEEYWNRDDVPGMREMIAQFRNEDGTSKVFLLKDEEGRFVLPEYDYYGITVWDVSQGYYVNVNEDVAGSWSGVAIPATEAIPVDAGWNMIPYYPGYDVTCRGPDFQAISSIVHNVVIVKNGWGEFAVPSLPFSNMRAWAAGMGFQIKVNADVSLVYPEEGGLNAVLADNRPDASSKHWTAPLSTGNNMSVLVTSVSGMMVNEGDEVAAFSSSGRIAGVGTFNADGQAGLGVWGDETITEEVVEGLIKGETFTLKIWDADRGEERRVAVNQGNALTYETNGLAVIDVTASAIVPDVYYLAQNFPNPFNAVTKVGYGLPEASYVTVRVFDVTGRVVATLVDGRQEAGRYVATWKADAAPAGVYFIKMESANFKQSVKTILMK